MKACTKCGIEKAKAEFNKASRIKGGVRSTCKDCDAEYRAANREKIAEYCAANAERINARSAEYYAANRERLNARSAEYYAANREKIAEYYAANAERIKARSAEYRNANPDKNATNSRNRRARKRNADGKHTAADIRAIFDKQQGLCANCQTKLFKSGSKKYHIDHIMPLALGGSNWPENLQCLCPSCNLSKGAKHPDEWAAANGRLL